ncbi:hypothetical protein V8E54_000355 [Elaphomyces granulatus]
MSDTVIGKSLAAETEFPFLQRKSLCISGIQPEAAVQDEDPGFAKLVAEHLNVAENNAAGRLMALKRSLRVADAENFWRLLMEGVTSICNAQYGFAVKQVIYDDTNHTLAIPSICVLEPRLSAVAFYYCDGHGLEGIHRNHQYLKCGTPCAHDMRHDKVCLIPNNLNSFAHHCPNRLPFPAHAYLAIPLFSDDNCVAHFGLMWSDEGLRNKALSWSYMELILHSFEDMVLQRILEGNVAPTMEIKVAPEALSLTQKHSNKPQAPSQTIFFHSPLKSYARSMSHELRTPMQGVVGMLDVMQVTAQEVIQSNDTERAYRFLHDFTENIELIQDSAGRALEAADNVVHAYDLNMQVPETPKREMDDEILGNPILQTASSCESRRAVRLEGSHIAINPHKRRRSSSLEWTLGPAAKHRSRKASPHRDLSFCSGAENSTAVHMADKLVCSASERRLEDVVVGALSQRHSLAARRFASRILIDGCSLIPSGLQPTKIRDLLRLVINESLRVGGRPESSKSEPIFSGEKITVLARSSNEETTAKIIEWSVKPEVPETFLVDERDLVKLISCVFMNALKFTENGEISVSAALSSKGQYVLINIRDTGTGIPEAFLPNLFKPFSREDDSTTQSKDGLGLGLLVAKGLSRKMGGDLICVYSSTAGPKRGTEFQIRLPIRPLDISSKPATLYNGYGTPRQRDFDGTKRHGVSINKNCTKVPSLRVDENVSRQFYSKGTNCCGLRSPHKPSSPPSTASHFPDSHNKGLAEAYSLTFLIAEDNKINRKILVNMLRKLGYHDIYEAYDGKEAVRIMRDSLLSHRPLSASDSPLLQGEHDSSIENPLLLNRRSQNKKLKPIDLVLMDLWMPEMDGYDATARIFELVDEHCGHFITNDSSPHQSCPPCSEKDEKDDDNLIPSLPQISPTVLAVSADVTDEALRRAFEVGMEGYMTKPYTISDLQRLIAQFCGLKGSSRIGASREGRTRGLQEKGQSLP